MFEFDDEEDDQSCKAQRKWNQYNVVSKDKERSPKSALSLNSCCPNSLSSSQDWFSSLEKFIVTIDLYCVISIVVLLSIL